METNNKIIDIFKVKKQELLTPHYIKVTFHIPERLLVQMRSVKEGSNNKLFIPPKGIDTIYFPNREDMTVPKESIALVRT